MMRAYLWVGAFSVVSCHLCVVFGDNPAGTSPPSSSSSSSGGGGGAMHSDTASITNVKDDKNGGRSMDKTAKKWVAPTGEAVHLSEYIDASVSRMGPVTITGLGKASIIVDYLFGAFLPSVTNPAKYMANQRARKCFAEVDKRALEGLHPASSTAAIADNLSATTDTACGDNTAWSYCPHTGSLVQTMNPALLASNSDAYMLSPLFDEDGDRQEKDTDEGDIDAFLDEFFVDNDGGHRPMCPQAMDDIINHDGLEAVDSGGVGPMDRTAHHGYGNVLDLVQSGF